MIVFPLIRSIGLKVATASSRAATCACVPFISIQLHCTHRANILGQRNTELRSGPVSEPVAHAIDLVANLEVLDIVADRRDDFRKSVPWYRACALFPFSYKLRISSRIMWTYKASTNSVGRLPDVSPERFTMLAFPNSPFRFFAS